MISAIDGIGSASTLHQKKEYKRVVELLIRRGANPNYSKPDGFSPLHAATLRDSYDIAKLLLDNGADVNAVCQNGTVLHSAVENGISDALVKLLLDKGVDPNTINISGFTPLHLAAMKDSSTIASILLKKRPTLMPYVIKEQLYILLLNLQELVPSFWKFCLIMVPIQT